MLAIIRRHNKSIKKHRILFLLYCIIIGLVANLSVVTVPIAVPLNIGNVAALLILARLGPLWALVCFVFVTSPLPSFIAIILSLIQVVLFNIYIKKNSSNTTQISVIYFLAAILVIKMFSLEAIKDNLSFLIIYCSLSTTLFIWSVKAARLLLALYVNNEQLRKQSLQHQLSFRVGLYTAIPATLLITLGLNGLTSLELVKQMVHYQNEINSLKDNIELKLKDYIVKIETIVNTTEKQVTKNTLKLLVEQSPEFISSLVTDNNGIVRDFYKVDANTNNIGNLSVADRPYFYLVKQTKTSFISDTFKGRSLGDDQLFAVSTPIIRENKFDGVLQLAIKLNSLLTLFDKHNDSISHRILIDKSGRKVWGNNVSGDIGSVWTRPKDSEPMKETFLRKSIFNPLNPITFSKDAHHFIIDEKIGLTGWELYFFIDTNDLFIKLSIYFFLALALITIILEISVRLSKRFVKNYTQALEQLVDYTQQWDGKTLNSRALNLTQSALEIDTLAHSFINMQRRVTGAHNATISSMNEVRLLNEELEERVEKRTRELEEERDKANHLAAIKTRFLANMSHEIRTPITIIKGFTEQILPITHGEVHTALCKIEQNISHLQSIINDILDAAKIDEGKMTIAEQSVAIEPLLNSLSDALTILAHSKNLTTQLDINLSNIKYIKTDPYRLKQILLNFISNAVKFTQKGTIKLVANITDKNELYIAIIDNGIGISSEQASSLFHAFTQADSSTSRDYGGTGLGLFISKQLANAMSLQLNMHSTVGIGSCFSITLPAEKLINNVAITHDEINIIQNEIIDWKKKSILFVDDVEDIRDLVAIYLKDTGISIDFGVNGEEAIQLASLKHYDLIILDQQMPVIDGLTAANTIRAMSKNIPLLLLSADIFYDDSEKNSAFNKKITKPFSKQQLIDTLQYFLGENQSTYNKQKKEDDILDNDLTIEYLKTLPNTLSLLKQLINDGEVTKLGHELHKLKGTSACLGLSNISSCAAHLNVQLKNRMITLEEINELSTAITDALLAENEK
ncbi:response regulator [Shewanella sp. DNRA4]|uniref:hybrid sensor histidine kinase/response regulator n=1 Tax=Shewanella sp. DNRA4 TaxID=2723055 RepID=UPI00146F815F|nr:ATP-binding protein [Shewanella sp. DNRA4]NMD52438.1 response regulator [Shewanella sp. DNRA4]